MDLIALGKTPISADGPTGSDVRYEPKFEELQAEINKLSQPSASGKMDWQKVCDLAALILATQSKDLLVAGYLAVSQVHLNQLEGLIVGLEIIHDLLDQYWENLYPPKKRLRGRIGAIEWWIERSAAVLEGSKPLPSEAATLARISTSLSKIETLLNTHLTDPPSLGPIQRIIKRSTKKITAQETEKTLPQPQPLSESETSRPEPQSQQPPSPQTAAPAAAEPMSSENIHSDGDVRRVINSWQQMLRKVAVYLLQKNNTDPLAYCYRRIATWSPLYSLPPVNGGVTQFQSPPPQVKKALNDLRENGNHSALIESAEQRLSQYMYWFDLNRWVIESMDVLGDGYRPAREAVCRETAFLLQRLPGLRDLVFSDWTPFADPATKDWLDRIEFNTAAAVTVPAAVTEASHTVSQEDPRQETIAMASALANKKQLGAAMGLLCEKMRRCFSQKEALAWRLAISQILIGCRRLDLALPHLELILKDIETFQLASWDPELALEGFKWVWTGFHNHKDKAVQKNAVAVFRRIAELDPVAALTLKK